MDPYYTDESVTLYHGDADGTLGGVALLPELAASVDAIITDPPYNVSGGDRSGREGTTPGRLKRKDGTSRTVHRDFGSWDRAWTPDVLLKEAHRLLREGGSLIAFTSEFLLGAFVASGLNHRNMIYWRKSNPTPAFKSLYVRAVEMAVWQVPFSPLLLTLYPPHQPARGPAMADEIDWEAFELAEMDRQERDGEMRALIQRVEALEAEAARLRGALQHLVNAHLIEIGKEIG